MDFENLGNTSVGWILFDADMSLKLLYTNKYKPHLENLKNTKN